MSKKLVQSTQCRRCLAPLTWIEVAKIDKTKECRYCPSQEPELKNDKFVHPRLLAITNENNPVPTKFPLCERQIIVKKLLDKDLCKKCLDKDEKKAKRIKRAQRKIGIKATRKKKTQWKEKPTKLESNKPLPVFYLKRRKTVIYTKYSLKGKWKKTSVQKLAHLERNYLCRGNPDEILSVT